MRKKKPQLTEVLSFPASLALGGTLFLFLLGGLFFHPHFQTNDDVVLSWITRGIGMVDQPSEFLLTINVLVGLLLKNLNLWKPAIPWYGLCLYAVFFLSTWAFIASLLSQPRPVWVVLMFSAVGIPVFFHCFAWPQYTVFCFLAAQAGILLFANPVQPRRLAFTLAGLLLFCASLIRLETALFVFGLGSLYLFQTQTGEKDATLNRTRLKALALAALFVASGWGFDRIYYHAHPGWEEARLYHSKRFSIREIKVTDYQKQEAAFRSVGWSLTDYRLFTEGLHYGPAFALENLKELNSHLSIDPRVKLDLFTALFQNPLVRFLFLTFVITAAMASAGQPRTLRWTAWMVFWVGLLFIFNKIVARVLWPQLFFSAVVSLLLIPPQREKSNPSRKYLPYLWVFLLAVLGTRMLHEDYLQNRPGPQVHQWIADSMEALAPRENHLFVIWGSSFPFTGFPVFGMDDNLKNFRFVWMWWLERTPYTEAQLSRFGIKDLMRDTTNRPDVFWIFNPAESHFQDYFRERFGLEATAQPAFHGYFDAYRIRSTSVVKKP